VRNVSQETVMEERHQQTARRLGDALSDYGYAIDRCIADFVEVLGAMRVHPEDRPKLEAALLAWRRGLTTAREEFFSQIEGRGGMQ
jgi:hypothetical protein